MAWSWFQCAATYRAPNGSGQRSGCDVVAHSWLMPVSPSGLSAPTLERHRVLDGHTLIKMGSKAHFFLRVAFVQQFSRVREYVTGFDNSSAGGAGSNPEVWVGGAPSGVWLERWVPAAEAVIEGLGYQLADIERAGRGLLRVTLDSPNGIGVEDCERVSHQLSRLFEVEAVSYDRLEVSSPGVDRALRRARDFELFLGEEVALKLRRPLENRKQFSGVLGKREDGQYTLLIAAEKKGEAERELVFALSELDSARLVPHLNFRRAST